MVELFYIEAGSSATLGSILYIHTDNDNEQYGQTAGGSTKTQLAIKIRTNDDVKIKYIAAFFTDRH